MSQSGPSFQPETLSAVVTPLSTRTPSFGPKNLKEEAAVCNEAEGKCEEENERISPSSQPARSQGGDCWRHCSLPAWLPLQRI